MTPETVDHYRRTLPAGQQSGGTRPVTGRGCLRASGSRLSAVFIAAVSQATRTLHILNGQKHNNKKRLFGHTMRQLQTTGDLKEALQKGGFLYITRRNSKNRLHTTKCSSFEKQLILYRESDEPLGTGEACQIYTFFDTFSEAQEHIIGESRRSIEHMLCLRCKPRARS